MHIKIKFPKITSKGNGFTGSFNMGKLWVPTAPGIAEALAKRPDHALVECADYRAADGPGDLYFASGVARVGFPEAAPVRPGVQVCQTERDASGGYAAIDYPKPAPAQAHKLARVAALFERAKARGAKRVAFAWSDPALRVYLGKKGIAVTNGAPYGAADAAFYGYVSDCGEWRPTRATPAGVVEFLLQFDADPAAVARVTGQLSGHCCFCGRELETRESVAVGYGPVCAENLGLPWGEAQAHFADIVPAIFREA